MCVPFQGSGYAIAKSTQFLHVDSEDRSARVDSQTDLSLWDSINLSVCFVLQWLIFKLT